jgi:hypothetical protein
MGYNNVSEATLSTTTQGEGFIRNWSTGATPPDLNRTRDGDIGTGIEFQPTSTTTKLSASIRFAFSVAKYINSFEIQCMGNLTISISKDYGQTWQQIDTLSSPVTFILYSRELFMFVTDIKISMSAFMPSGRTAIVPRYIVAEVWTDVENFGETGLRYFKDGKIYSIAKDTTNTSNIKVMNDGIEIHLAEGTQINNTSDLYVYHNDTVKRLAYYSEISI